MSLKDEKIYFYDRFADNFDIVMDVYDTHRRLMIIFDEFLVDQELQGKRLLDAGSGTGWFSKWAVDRGARVTSLDVGINILKKVREKCSTDLLGGDICMLNLKKESFDFVISSEMIEHTPDPRKAVQNLCEVLKPGGILVLTVPNKIWHFSVVFANALRIRPYEGYEKWVGWWELQKWLEEEGMIIDRYQGFHLFPFIFEVTHPVLRFFDRFGNVLGPVMVNIAVKARKLR